jgi:NitT/TauT family transport system ATP-binding protein
VPVIGWIADEIRAAERKRQREEHFLEALAESLGPEEARRQLDTAVNWGRYAELFDYDSDSDELFVEE